MGPSGSGKTTLLSVLGCILSPSEGVVRVCGKPTTDGGADASSDILRQRARCTRCGHKEGQRSTSMMGWCRLSFLAITCSIVGIGNTHLHHNIKIIATTK